MASDYALSQVHAPKICKVGTHVEPCATCDAAHGRPASCTVKGRAPLMEPDRRNRCCMLRNAEAPSSERVHFTRSYPHSTTNTIWYWCARTSFLDPVSRGEHVSALGFGRRAAQGHAFDARSCLTDNYSILLILPTPSPFHLRERYLIPPNKDM